MKKTLFLTTLLCGATAGVVVAQDTTNTFVGYTDNIVYKNDSSDASSLVPGNYKLTMSENKGEIIFINNAATDNGGAINLVGTASGANPTMEVDNNSGAIRFENNISKQGNGGAIYGGTGSATTGDYNCINFRNNSTGITLSGNQVLAESGGERFGGAVYIQSGTVLFSGNGNVTISDNIANGRGGAVYAKYLNFVQNVGDIRVTGNRSKAVGSYGGQGGAFNATVVFEGNEGMIVLSDNVAESQSSYGGGLMRGSATFTGNKQEILISSNTARNTASGGAIYDAATFRQNEAAINIIGNTAGNEGGAIYGATRLDGNKQTITFKDNSAAKGGAIANSLAASGNTGDILFEGNRAEHESRALGGAIHHSSSSKIEGNEGSVSFVGNSAVSGAEARGGAIHIAYQTLTFQGNKGDISFTGNTAQGSTTATGGAVEVYDNNNAGRLELTGNAKVSFTGNGVISDSTALGGAVHVTAKSTLVISDNNEVTFRGNYEKAGNNVRLRSVYAEGSLQLGAAKEGKVTFYDSIYAAKALQISGGGTVVFSGAHVAEDLNSLRREFDLAEATESQIATSSTSYAGGGMTLTGGRLVVEDGAILSGGTLTGKTAGTSLVLNGGTMAMALDLGTMNLVLQGNNNSFTGNVNLSGTTLALEPGSSSAVMSKDFTGNGIVDVGEGVKAGEKILLLTCTGTKSATFRTTASGTVAWEGDDLYYTALEDWVLTNESASLANTPVEEGRNFVLNHAGLDLADNAASNNNLIVTGGSSSTLNGAGAYEGNVTVKDAATLQVTGNAKAQDVSVKEGATFRTEGSLSAQNVTVDGNATLRTEGSLSAQHVTVDGGATLESTEGMTAQSVTLKNGTLGGREITSKGTVVLESGSVNATVSAPTVVKQGEGEVHLNAAGKMNNLTVNGGTLVLNADNAAGTNTSYTLNVQGAGSTLVNNGVELCKSTVIDAGAVLVAKGGSSFTYTAKTDAVTLNKGGRMEVGLGTTGITKSLKAQAGSTLAMDICRTEEGTAQSALLELNLLSGSSLRNTVNLELNLTSLSDWKENDSLTFTLIRSTKSTGLTWSEQSYFDAFNISVAGMTEEDFRITHTGPTSTNSEYTVTLTALRDIPLIPEPTTATLSLLALAALATRRRRK